MYKYDFYQEKYIKMVYLNLWQKKNKRKSFDRPM